VILVRPGEKVPLDGDILEGKSLVDTSALTGESVPRTVNTGDTVLAGMINQSGALTVQVTKPFAESSIARILELVENASSKKADTEKFITRFARYYTPVVVFLSLAVAILPPLLLPGATQAVVDLPGAGAAGHFLSLRSGDQHSPGLFWRRGWGSQARHSGERLDVFRCPDPGKNGGLRQNGHPHPGQFRVTDVVTHNGFSQHQLLDWRPMPNLSPTIRWRSPFVQAYGQPSSVGVQDYEEISGHGIRATVNGPTVLAGNDRLLHREAIPHDVCVVEGTVAHLAVDGEYSGRILIADELKSDAVEAIRALQARDSNRHADRGQSIVADRIARQLGLDQYRAELLPEDKVAALEVFLQQAQVDQRQSRLCRRWH
jgi:Cd2+/Zn2+-exporting ATPase